MGEDELDYCFNWQIPRVDFESMCRTLIKFIRIMRFMRLLNLAQSIKLNWIRKM